MEKKLKGIIIVAVASITALSVGFMVYASNQKDQGNYIGEVAAKEKALADAGINEKDVRFVTTKLDEDFTSAEYDIEFYSGNKEYDYEIDAVSGKVLTRDFDIEDGEYSNKGTNDVKTAATDQADMKQDNTNTTQTDKNYIDTASAKNIALTHAGLTESEAFNLTCDFDYENGSARYEVNFQVGQNESEYEIDATTGEIIYFNSEIDD